MEVATYIGMYVCITVCLKAFLSQACRPTCSYVYGYTNVHTYVCMKIYVECSMKWKQFAVNYFLTSLNRKHN